MKTKFLGLVVVGLLCLLNPWAKCAEGGAAYTDTTIKSIQGTFMVGAAENFLSAPFPIKIVPLPTLPFSGFGHTLENFSEFDVAYNFPPSLINFQLATGEALSLGTIQTHLERKRIVQSGSTQEQAQLEDIRQQYRAKGYDPVKIEEHLGRLLSGVVREFFGGKELARQNFQYFHVLEVTSEEGQPALLFTSRWGQQ